MISHAAPRAPPGRGGGWVWGGSADRETPGDGDPRLVLLPGWCVAVMPVRGWVGSLGSLLGMDNVAGVGYLRNTPVGLFFGKGLELWIGRLWLSLCLVRGWLVVVGG